MKDENMLKKKDFADAAIMRGLGFNTMKPASVRKSGSMKVMKIHRFEIPTK